MDTLNELYQELLNKVFEDDLHSQQYYLKVVEDQRKISVDYLLSLGALFIPNNDYIYHYLGTKADSFRAGLYIRGVTPWMLCVVFPIRTLSGEIKGLTAWDAYNKYLEQSEDAVGLSTYRVSPVSIFPKDKFFLTDIKCLREHFNERVIFITDGVFDAISLNYRGIPAIALLGSTFSREVLYYLRWYRAIYVCTDNDKAGVVLYQRLKKAVPNVYRVVQGRTKDIEELLRYDGVDGVVTEQLRSLVKSPVFVDYTIRGK